MLHGQLPPVETTGRVEEVDCVRSDPLHIRLDDGGRGRAQQPRLGQLVSRGPWHRENIMVR